MHFLFVFSRRFIPRLVIIKSKNDLCKPPQQLLIDFMDNLSCGSWKRQGRDQAKEDLIEYFLDHRYGQNYYSPGDLRQIFKEMDAVGLLFPSDDGDMIDVYADWRKNITSTGSVSGPELRRFKIRDNH